MENTSLTTAYGGRKTAPLSGKTLSRVGMDAALSKISTGERTLSEGSILKARVVDFMGKELSLRLPDGSLIQAKTSQGTALSIGQNAEFQVLHSDKEQLLLRLVNSDNANSANSIAGRALSAAGLPVNEENLQLVNTLLENRLPVDADSIRLLAHQANLYKGTDVSTLARMNQYNIPVNKASIEQYNSYLNYEHQLMPQMEGLAEQLSSPELSGLLEEYGFSLEGLEAKEDEAVETVSRENPEIADNPEKTDASVRPENPEKAETAVKTENSENNAAAIKADSPEKTEQASQNTKTEETNPQAAPKEDGFLDAKATEGVNFLKRWTLTPEQLKKEGSIEKVFEKLNSDMKQLTSAIRRAKANNPELEEGLQRLLADAEKTAQNLRDNLEFMNLLNRFFPYVQLPMRMNEKYQQGELYVYSRKKAKSADGSASVLLHLDMEFLGQTDIYLNLTGTTLGAKFYLPDDSAEVFTEHLPELTERLEKQGLTVNCELLPREEAEKPLHDFLAPEENISMKRYRFDCRA